MFNDLTPAYRELSRFQEELEELRENQIKELLSKVSQYEEYLEAIIVELILFTCR